MPGLSQLKKFNSDIISLGNEPEYRAKYGEKVVSLEIPANIQDVDDSDDFVLGMPQIPEENLAKKENSENPDEQNISAENVGVPDLSSLVAGNAQNAETESGIPDLSMFEESEPETEPEKPEEKKVELADLSLEDLLSGEGFDGSSGTTDENAQNLQENSIAPEAQQSQENPIIPEMQETNQAVSSSGLPDLDDVLAAISDDSKSEQEPLVEQISDDLQTQNDLPPLDDLQIQNDLPPLDDLQTQNDLPPLDDLQAQNDLPPLEDLQAQNDLPPLEDLPQLEEISEMQSDSNTLDIGGLNISSDLNDESLSGKSFSVDDLAELSAEIKDNGSGNIDLSNLQNPDDVETFQEVPTLNELNLDDLTAGIPTADEIPADDLNSTQILNDIPVEDFVPEESAANSKPVDSSEEKSPVLGADSESSSAGDDLNLGDFAVEEYVAPEKDLPDASSLESFSPEQSAVEEKLADIPTSGDSGLSDFGDIDGLQIEEFVPEKSDGDSDKESFSDIPVSNDEQTANVQVPSDAPPPNDELSLSGDFNLDDFNLDEIPDMNLGADAAETASADDLPQNISLPDDVKLPDMDESAAAPSGLFDSSDLDLPDINAGMGDDFGISGDTSGNLSEENLDEQAKSEDSFKESNFDAIEGDGFSLDSLDFDSAGDDANSFENTTPPETYDTSDMEGMEFPDTDEQLSNSSGFELGDSGDFGFENSDFEIPGFSDVETVIEQKYVKKKDDDKTEKKDDDEDELKGLPPYTLSDEQYAKFLKNLSGYPLNVRIAFEDLIVKNEFTDDAEFDLIKKVLKKVPARQLASELEKMLDIALPVPRDFERRTTEEYEAYKSSFQYQLRNKIIPGAIIGVIATGLCVLLFLFSKHFIYMPARASYLYKQGYVLLENENYPQSEERFNEAVKYDLQKKWFFKYARGYRDHKQYVRSEQMFKNILRCFKHDKKAGLEYARMELDELENYESAEKILLREVLDYHINDPDGILQLGDTYLEWATEKDSSKFVQARDCYTKLINLYKPTDLYMSRMMRYFIRTDNLIEVLQLKDQCQFVLREKSLSGQDWMELSGFLLDKLYGELQPNEEYLRSKIADVKKCLTNAVKYSPESPIAAYNMSRYYVQMNNSNSARLWLSKSIDMFANAKVLKTRDMYKYIDSYRLLGEEYVDEREFLKARESYTAGISLFSYENENSGFKGNKQIGKLYADMGDIDYFISGDMDAALLNYKDSVDNENDTPEIRYKIGYIQYSKKNYTEALGSFMKAMEDCPEDMNLLLAMGNTLSLREDVYACEGYYEHLLELLNYEKEQKGILLPHIHLNDADIVDLFVKATNNLGVALFRLARRTGNSQFNAQSINSFQQSVRAWDALTRNQKTLVRLGGSNLAEQNIKYISNPYPDYEPAIYTDIERTLTTEESLKP